MTRLKTILDSVKYGGIKLQINEIPLEAIIEIEVKSNGRTMSFRSETVDIDNFTVLVNPIKVNDKTIGFDENCIINLLYISDGKLFVWNNIDIKLIKLDGVVYHKIIVKGEGKPYNRRSSYRMYIGEDMSLYINTPTGSTAITVLVKDISESGVAFITKEDLSIGRTFRLKLKDHNRLINLSGIIIRKDYLEHLDSFLYGCKFNESNATLGYYIAKKQNDLLKKNSNNYSSPHSLQGRTRHTVRSHSTIRKYKG